LPERRRGERFWPRITERERAQNRCPQRAACVAGRGLYEDALEPGLTRDASFFERAWNIRA
jgi:hypothetical protein